jgi:hypothetical protein
MIEHIKVESLVETEEEKALLSRVKAAVELSTDEPLRKYFSVIPEICAVPKEEGDQYAVDVTICREQLNEEWLSELPKGAMPYTRETARRFTLFMNLDDSVDQVVSSSTLGAIFFAVHQFAPSVLVERVCVSNLYTLEKPETKEYLVNLPVLHTTIAGRNKHSNYTSAFWSADKNFARLMLEHQAVDALMRIGEQDRQCVMGIREVQLYTKRYYRYTRRTEHELLPPEERWYQSAEEPVDIKASLVFCSPVCSETEIKER